MMPEKCIMLHLRLRILMVLTELGGPTKKVADDAA
ncbi:hypothetical protein SLEP1_g48817 [Rubroshorea leprosula]|uniref:Uncharacterized protein n=1 Tax=Rubroshorea leprosula TaxID=152421 RepID=A0AAV5LUR3_9ROSI|nr:hypothetical protein SLEP1_g48817 [Rubroshorea leprosula]